MKAMGSDSGFWALESSAWSTCPTQRQAGTLEGALGTGYLRENLSYSEIFNLLQAQGRVAAGGVLGIKPLAEAQDTGCS